MNKPYEAPTLTEINPDDPNLSEPIKQAIAELSVQNTLNNIEAEPNE